MKGSVSEPHSDQRDHLLDERVPDDLVRGHRFWTAVKVRGRHRRVNAALASSVYAATGRAPRAGSYVVPCFHNA